MNILCIRLPKQDTSGAAARDNVAYDAARVMASAEAAGLIARGDWAFLEEAACDFGGDAAIASAVLRRSPELVLFSLQDWNLERSLWIAKRLRSVLPATHFAAFGPEVVQGMPLYKAHAFDALIEGEPEEAFCELLDDLAHRSLKPRYAARRPLHPDALPEPYLTGALVPDPAKPIVMELGRGRAQAPVFARAEPGGVRLGDRERIARVLRLGSDAGADEARLLGPPLDDREDLRPLLKALAAANEGGLALSGAIAPTIVDDEVARLLADASFAQLYAELGSVAPPVLEAARLRLDKDGFERGARLLWAQGIVVRPELYLGLPQETYDSTIEAFDFLGMLGLGQDAELRPVPVAPGSALREGAPAYGIKEFLEHPPYWITSTEWMDDDDLADAVADFEESFDVAWSQPIAPCFQAERGGFSSFVDLRRPGGLDALLVAPDRLASSVTILLDSGDPERAARLVRAARDIRRENPYGLWQFVLRSDSGLPPPGLVERLADAFSMPEHYFELSRAFSLDPQPDYQARAFFATASEPLALAALRERHDLETVYIIGDAMPSPRLLSALPFLAFDREAMAFELLYDIMSAYRDYPDLLIEAPREALA